MDEAKQVWKIQHDDWPPAVSDGLTLPCGDCGDCGVGPRFDYRVSDVFWLTYVPEESKRRGVICLPCLDRRCKGANLAESLLEVQWVGTGHTIVLTPTVRYEWEIHDD